MSPAPKPPPGSGRPGSSPGRAATPGRGNAGPRLTGIGRPGSSPGISATPARSSAGPLSLPLSLSLSLSLSPSLCVFLCPPLLSLSVFVSVCLSLPPPLLSLSPSLYISLCPPSLSLCLFVSLSLFLSLCSGKVGRGQSKSEAGSLGRRCTARGFCDEGNTCGTSKAGNGVAETL